jgi:hypothetical protein
MIIYGYFKIKDFKINLNIKLKIEGLVYIISNKILIKAYLLLNKKDFSY